MSNNDVDMATIQLNGEKMNFLLGKKDFKTGSRGYHAQGKMIVRRQKLSSKHSSS